jgi:superfamily II DNA/RNA helicase
MSFENLGLSEKVLRAVTASGYTQPTPIQEQAIPHVLQRRDVLGIAQTGTGKTAAFTLPMITLLENGRARARMPRTLILEPTRELAAQVEESFVKYGVDQKLSVALLIGGVSFGDQDAKLMRGVDVLIATPGRLLDHVERGKLLLTGVELLVIDEADRMLDMGFIPDIERIAKFVPFTRQTLFFSATMPPEIQRLADTFLHNPVRIEVARPATTAGTIVQRLVASGKDPHDKREVLRQQLRAAEDFKTAIVFCNRKSEVAILHKSLRTHGFNAVCLHGDMDQRSRTAALDAFRAGEASILVASDVAARGLDIPDVSHVFNFDVPHHADDYVHRIGRTGRAGRKGTAITIVSVADEKSLGAIEKLTGQDIVWDGPKPSELPPSTSAPRDRDRGRSRGGRERDERPARRERREGPRPEARASAGPAVEAVAEAAGIDTPREPRQGRERSGSDRPRQERAHSEHSRQERPTPERPVQEPRFDARPPRAEREERRPQAHATPRSADRGFGERRPHRRDHDDDSPVVGLGDHVPAFLLRPVKAPPAPETRRKAKGDAA